MFAPCCHKIANISKRCLYQRQILQNVKLITSAHQGKIDANVLNFSTNTPSFIPKDSNPGFFKTILKKIPFLDVSKTRLKATGFLLYEVVADNLNYDEFFAKYDLPDTFYSWFVITELHVWMLSVRAMAEGEDGRYARNSIVQAMWSDVQTRAKKLGAANPAGVRAQVDELSEQFQAALIAYDEGLLTSDTVLASALWRRFFQQDCDSPQHLESLVLYVRKQVKMLDHISSDEFIEKRQIKWLPLQR